MGALWPRLPPFRNALTVCVPPLFQEKNARCPLCHKPTSCLHGSSVFPKALGEDRCNRCRLYWPYHVEGVIVRQVDPPMDEGHRQLLLRLFQRYGRSAEAAVLLDPPAKKVSADRLELPTSRQLGTRTPDGPASPGPPNHDGGVRSNQLS